MDTPPRLERSPNDALTLTVGVTALTAPALHSLTDALEWLQHGFTSAQLWINYIAFLPMPWLLLGLYAVQPRRPGVFALIGALLSGAAFTYFAHTTLYALTERIANYEALWERLDGIYTAHGALMVCGGVMFSWSSLRGGSLPKGAVLLFLAGILINLVLALLHAPDILQTIGSTARNLGLMIMGYAVLCQRRQTAA